jgi:hypothetical protein
MTQTGERRSEPANMAGIIERLAGELALGEEPARFIAVLESEAETPRDE